MKALTFGSQHLELDLPPERLLARLTGPEALGDPVGALQEALEAPRDYPPLWQALTPDDHLAVVVDEQLPHLGALVTALLEHIGRAGVAPEQVTLLCAEKRPSRPWLPMVRAAYPGVALEEHEAGDRRRLSYLAGTAGGRAIYLNRTLVDADQVVILTGRRFDPALGHGGGEGELFPALSDETTRAELNRVVRELPPRSEPWPALAEAHEVAWLLGAPFFVQIIAAAGDGIAQVLAGPAASCPHGERLLDAAWRATVPRRADTVIATINGTPGRQRFAELAVAAACATRVVVPGGRVVLLSEAEGDPGPGAEVLARSDEPGQALAALERSPAASPAALLWARAANHARLAVLSRLEPAAVEGLFAAPLRDTDQARRLAAEGGLVLIVEDAHRLLAVVE